MAHAIPPQPSAIHEQVEPQYALAGFVFSGSAASLTKLKAAADAAGLRLKPYVLPSQNSSLVISGSDAFGKLDVFMAFLDKVSERSFGPISFALISEPPSPR